MSIKPFLSNGNEYVTTRESKKYVEGVNSKVKLELYYIFGKEVEFKRYLHGVPELDFCLNLGQEHIV